MTIIVDQEFVAESFRFYYKPFRTIRSKADDFTDNAVAGNFDWSEAAYVVTFLVLSREVAAGVNRSREAYEFSSQRPTQVPPITGHGDRTCYQG
jgi:hypothetical protein